MMCESLKVLFVDDDPAWLNALKRRVHRNAVGWEYRFAVGGQEALEMMAEQVSDVVVSDLNMPGIRGDSLLRQIADLYPNTLRFILSASSAPPDRSDTSQLAMDFIPKDQAAQDLLFRIASGVSLRGFVKSRIVDPLAEAIGRVGELPDLMMNIENPTVLNGLERTSIEIRCPQLGLEFRALIPEAAGSAEPATS